MADGRIGRRARSWEICWPGYSRTETCRKCAAGEINPTQFYGWKQQLLQSASFFDSYACSRLAKACYCRKKPSQKLKTCSLSPGPLTIGKPKSRAIGTGPSIGTTNRMPKPAE